FPTSCRFRAVLLVSLACLVSPAVWADDDDTPFLPDQTPRTIEQKAQSHEAPAAASGPLKYAAQRYQVQSTVADLTPAIHVSLDPNQWTQLPDFIARYRELPGHRPALANMAESLLARFEGDYPLALQRMELASEQEPRDARILLELARLWFE